MNKFFLPNENEIELLNILEASTKSKQCLIRITPNMLRKHHIDANKEFRKNLSDANFFDFEDLVNGNKNIQKVKFVNESNVEEKIISFNRSSNRGVKKGDARFWIPYLKSSSKIGDLFCFFVYNSELYCYNVSSYKSREAIQSSVINIISNSFENIKHELSELFRKAKSAAWIKSISPKASCDKDVGDTFESFIGIKANCSGKADFKERIEIKSKRLKSKSKDSTFNRIPDPDISPIKTTKELVLKYGYDDNNSAKYPHFSSLFIQVNHKPNKQGFYLEVDVENERVVMKHQNDGLICAWKFEILKKKLEEKHPSTLWIMADETIDEEGDICFKYLKAELTIKADFAKFLQLIEDGKVVYNWRARVRKDGTGYNDHGNGFRMGVKQRKIVYGEAEDII